jgi:hypothetical protein
VGNAVVANQLQEKGDKWPTPMDLRANTNIITAVNLFQHLEPNRMILRENKFLKVFKCFYANCFLLRMEYWEWLKLL